MTNKLKANIFVFLCIIIWSFIPVVSKLAQTSLDNHQFLFWSSLVSFISLLFVTIISKKIKAIKKYNLKDWFILICLGLLGTYLYYLFLYLGYKETKGLEVLVIQYTWPLTIALLSVFILFEKLNAKKCLSIFIGFIGVVLVLTKGDFTKIQLDNAFVILLVFLGAFSFALFSVLAKKVNYEPIVAITIYFFSSTVASGISLNYFSFFVMPQNKEIFFILLNGILLNGFSYLFWINALKLTQASNIVAYIFLIPVLSAVYLVLFFNETIQLAYILGFALVIFAGLLNSLNKN